MKSFTLVSLAIVFTCCVISVSSNAGTWAGFRRMDTGTATLSSTSTQTNTRPRVNRGGADDPANHDLGDDRGVDQNGGHHQRRHRGRHRGPGQ